MNRIASRIAAAGALAALALAFASTLTSCGSGAVGPSTVVNDPSQITIQPGQCIVNGTILTCNNPAILYSGLPTTFVITGGTDSYVLSSNNQQVLPVSGSIVGHSVTLFPNPVLVDTDVILTVRDTGATPIATAKVTVRPGTVANNITITPSSTQGGSCLPAVCSGGDALVTATLSQGGIPLPARGVRFEVVSGDFRFITSAPGATTETLDTQVTVITDETGKASARLRATADAANQTALLQVTDLGTGAFQRASFVIAQATGTSPGFFVSPTTVVFQGVRTDQCAGIGISATFFVFGGAPPYTISNTSSAFFVSRDFVSFSGGSFTVTPNGTCVDKPGAPIIVRDSTGRTVTVLAANIPGTQTVPSLVVGPSTVTLSSCSTRATVTASGGTGNYIAGSGNDSVLVTPAGGGMFTISRNSPSPAIGPSPATVIVSISDGNTSKDVTVTLTGEGAGACPALTATPSSVTLTSCTVPVTVQISGGTGNLSAVSDNASVGASTTPGSNVVSIQRVALSAAFTPPASVTVSDSSNPVRRTTITVNATGAGAGGC